MYILIVAKVISTAWYIILIHMYCDMVANLVIVFSMGRRSSPRVHKGTHDSKSPQPGHENTTGIPTQRKSKENERDTYFTDQQPQSIFAAYNETSKEAPKTEHFMIVFQSQADPEDDEVVADDRKVDNGNTS